MKLFLVIVLLLFAGRAGSKDYLDYYQAIARAEAAIVHASYNDALTMYDSAFADFPYNNPIDLYVAAQIAGFLGQLPKAEGYMLKGISFGLPLQTAQANPHLQGAIAATGVSFEQKADSCTKLYRGRINGVARARMIALIRFDQGIIRNVTGSIYNGKGRELKKEYVPVWDSLLLELKDITLKWGFPAQKVIGTQNGDDSLFRISPGNAYAYYILVHHGHAWPVLKDLLPGELRRGNITPQMYGAIADYSNDHEDYARMEYFAVRLCEATVNRRRCRKAIAGRLDNINEARRQIGLCTYEVASLKLQSNMQYYARVKSGVKDSGPLFDFQINLNQW